MAKKNYNFFYLLLIYYFFNSVILIDILYKMHHNQAAIHELKGLIYTSFALNLLFIIITAIYAAQHRIRSKQQNDNHDSILQHPEFQLLMDKIRSGIIITDRNGIIKFANTQASSITEFELQDMVKKHYSKIFTLTHSDKDKNSRFIIDKVLENGCVISNKIPRTIICCNNQKKEILSSANPIFAEDNSVSGVILSFLDVSEDFEKIKSISEENKLLNETINLANLCYFRKNLVNGKISGSANLSHFWAFHSDHTAYADNEWISPDDLANYQESVKNFLSGDEHSMEIIYRSNYYSDLRYFRQIICKNENPNIISGIIQDITNLFTQKNDTHTEIIDNQAITTMTNSFDSHNAIIGQKKMSILIVDYEINNCNVLALTFTKLNYNVRVTTTPNSALEYLKNCKVDIILANLALPNMNAIEFAKEVRIHYGFDIMIYVILNDMSLKDKLNLHIFNGVLVKPITLEQIKKTFESHR